MAAPLRLYGLKALIINAASGIGEAVSRTLVKHGARVLAVDTLDSGVEQHFATVKGIDGLAASLTDASRLPALVEQAVQQLGRIDILVNDFPLRVQTPLSDAAEELNELLRLREDLIMTICRSALPQLMKSPQGRIVNLGFLRSVFAVDGGAAFSDAQQNLAAITRTLSGETGEFGVTVNYIQPGAIMTPASRKVFQKNKALRDYCIAQSAAQRLGEPVDIAKVALFLASDDGAFVSGTGVLVDGGPGGGD